MRGLKGFSLSGVALLAGVLLLARTQAVPLIDPDEPRLARVSQEMLRSGDLVVPTFEGAPRLVKPPLLHWIQIPLFRTFGAGEWTARLPSVLATLGSMLILAWVVRRRFGPEGAVWAALFYCTMPLTIGLGRLGTLDALLSVHVLAAVALDLAEPEEAGSYRAGAIGGLLGLAFLAKGPVGLVLPLLMLLAGRSASGRGVLPDRGPLLAFLGLMALVVCPWGLAFLVRVGPGETLQLLRHEVLERFFVGTSHVKPAWYYVPVMLVGFFPWIAPLGVGVVRVFGRRRDPAARTALYAAAGLLGGLAMFSLSKGKLPNYILPLTPLACILVTWELGQELDDPKGRTLGPTLLAASLGAFGLVLLLAAGRYVEPPAHGVALAGTAIYISGSLLALVGVVRRRPRWVYGSAAAASSLFLLLIVTVLLPSLARSRSARELIVEVPQLDSARPVGVFEMELPSLTYYLDRVPEKIATGELPGWIDRDDAPLLVVDPVDLTLIRPAERRRLREIGRQGKYVVYEPIPPNERK